ncbi:hypothetical protein [Desulfovibrio sp. UIB00]|uniref:hypothetical protein n=1 Tax=Desulfovibrio sp. UIB00 TaxID=2804314 RepID=UPI001F101533|nr:hypothetical protein [Desulfovibrio sp. UIB00]MCH5144543.1 hypothetical protein [Desulfovibrio sp. UIB00]
MTSHFLRLALTLTALLCLYTEHVTEAKDLTGNSNIQFVRELYNNVRDTMPSEVNAVENTQAIQNRLKCYEENHDYGQRIQICNNKYVKSLVRLARKGIHSRPNLGEFVLNVDMCPILYNICMGQTEDDKERCILFERQCIDYTLDMFWRGSAQYTQQTYRLDQ